MRSAGPSGGWADGRPARAFSRQPQLVREAPAYTAEGEIAYFQEIFIPRPQRKLMFDSDLAI